MGNLPFYMMTMTGIKDSRDFEESKSPKNPKETRFKGVNVNKKLTILKYSVNRSSL